MQLFQSLSNQFENHRLFRRLVIVYAGFLMWWSTDEAFKFCLVALDTERSGGDIALIISAAMALPTGLMTYLYKDYSKTRNSQ